MPKGALLHCHLGALVDLSWVFGQAIETEGMCIISPAPLSDEVVRSNTAFKIEYSKLGISGTGSSIWTGTYKALTHVPLKEVAEAYPDGGVPGFVAWMKSLCSITQTDSLSHHLGISDIWRKLVFGFTMITPIVFYEPITRAFLREFFRTALEDGIRWIEIRGMTRSFRLEGEDHMVKDRTALVRVIDEEVKKFKGCEEGKALWGVKLIWDGLRSFGKELIIDGKLADFPTRCYDVLKS